MYVGVAVFIICMLASSYYAVKARFHLSEEGKKHLWLAIFGGVLVRKELFTEMGWAFFKRAMYILLLGFLFMILGAFSEIWIK